MEPKRECSKLFGARLKELRKLRGLSQAALSELSGLHRHYVSDIERGIRNPAVENIARLAWALHTTPADLFADFSPEALDAIFG
jgi:transcriptional regulator with XRE-family HTH domain